MPRNFFKATAKPLALAWLAHYSSYALQRNAEQPSGLGCALSGEVTERLKVHDWKSCVLQKGTGGSNPPLSAILKLSNFRPQRTTDAESGRVTRNRSSIRATGRP